MINYILKWSVIDFIQPEVYTEIKDFTILIFSNFQMYDLYYN